MPIFVRQPGVQIRRLGSRMALAVALATGSATAITGFAEPAYAQKKKKEEAPKKNYTKEFIAAYQPLAAKVEAEGADYAAIKAELPGMLALVQTDDDKFVAGNLVYTLGTKAKDTAGQRDGVVMMLASGKVAPEQVGVFNFLAGQLSYQLSDYPNARKYGIEAINSGYTNNSPEVFVAESFVAEKQLEQGLTYLSAAIERKLAAGQTVEAEWLKRGLSIAFNGQLGDHAIQYGYWYAKLYPSQSSWGDALAVLRRFKDLDAPAMLDLLRLVRATDTFRTRHEFNDYVEAADPRRLPGEVMAVIEKGYATGLVSKDDTYIADSYALAKSRVAADKADLPALEKDASAPSATLKLVSATADVFLSYGQGAKAEQFYAKALAMPDADAPVLLTRLGIAQVFEGKFAEAQDSFAKVQGSREPIARLWSAYAAQQAAAQAAPSGSPAP